MLTRLNMLFIGGSSFLLVMEIISPFFGWWHGISLLATIMLNLTGTRVLHFYSTRMVNSLWLGTNGSQVEIEFMNAFFSEKTETFDIRSFGYLQPSRVYNVDNFRYQ